ncbi:AfsR/SARP family transcriptional regulator [Williamsia sp. R60]
MSIEFSVLGSVTAHDGEGNTIALKGPRHRAVLARLLIARGRSVPLATLIDDLWEDPPPDAVGAMRTFVSALRRAIEPERAPRSPARLLVTEGTGYALRARASDVDAWRFGQAVESVRDLSPHDALTTLLDGLALWRGPAYADFLDEHWSRSERSRLTEVRLHAVELLAMARLDLALDAEAIPDLDSHVAEHPWREEGWRLLALALYRTGRQGDALTVLRRARGLLVDQLGVEPGPALTDLYTDILRQSPNLGSTSPIRQSAQGVWAQTTAAYDRAVATGSRARLRSTVDLLRSLATTGGEGLRVAQQQRLATIAAAEELGDVGLTAKVIGAYDVPAIWSRSDDPENAAAVVAAAERALATLPSGHVASIRARLLATIALETRGSSDPRAAAAAREAEQIARSVDDPGLLAFALNGAFMQSFSRAGLAGRRAAIASELITLSSRHDLVTYEVLGHLIAMQSCCAIGDLTGADHHAAAADRLAEGYESPLVAVFTQWFRALRLALTDAPFDDVTVAYRAASSGSENAGMPGLHHGLLALALLSLRLQRAHSPQAPDGGDTDWGPYEPWVRPLLLAAHHRKDEATEALRRLADPPPDHLQEALWCLTARGAIAVNDRGMMARAHQALLPAEGEIAGAGSGLLTLGPVSNYLHELADALAR